jgi:hypothetical protein
VWRFRRAAANGDKGKTSVAERPRDQFSGTDEEMYAELHALREERRSSPDRDLERRLLRLRHLAGLRVLAAEGGAPAFPSPDHGALPEQPDGLPEVPPDDLSPGLLRAGILRDGCVLVRGLIDRDVALRFAAHIDRAFEERERFLAGEQHVEGYYEEFDAEPPHGYGNEVRSWVREGGGLLAADSPMLAAEMLELLEAAGVPALVKGYLGEPALISAQKTTLRKAEPSVTGAWHQDGSFMHDVRALNLWLSLSRCGDVAPGLDIVPRRLDGLVATATEEAVLSYQVSQAKAEEAAGEAGVLSPVFEPGDALFFDELFLHQTGARPSMPNPRFAVETWFFGGSGFPTEYSPLAV